METLAPNQQSSDASLLAKLEEIITSSAPKNSNADRFPLATALTLLAKLFKVPQLHNVGEVFSDIVKAPDDRHFACAYLARMLATRPEVFEADHTATAKLLAAIHHSAPKEFLSITGIAEKKQTFEQAALLTGFIQRLERELTETVASLTDAGTFPGFRQSFSQHFRPRAAQFILKPFIAFQAPDIRFGEAFSHIDAYLNESGANKLKLFEQARETLEELKASSHTFNTAYSRSICVVTAEKLLTIITDDFERSAHVKPANLFVSGTEKRYPLAIGGARFHLSFLVENRGSGHAFNLQFSLIDVTGVELHDSLVFLGDLAPGSRIVEVDATVRKQSDDVLAAGRVIWRQFDGEQKEQEFLIPLAIQKCDLDWSALATEEPYALEPVANQQQLVGRETVLDQLLAQSRAPGVVSSLIIGQKRVGKTSIARTLQSAGTSTLNNANFIFLESGDYINPSPEATVAELGNCLCRAIKDCSMKLQTIPVPEFTDSLSPLVKFLSDVNRVVPDHKFIFILDEFDELPLALYKRSSAGDALFMTIRSISGKQPYGFVLVGSEKLNLILTFQGERLNKFTQFNVDYFDRNKEWTSYTKLVRNPVDTWLEIDDSAIVALYNETSGNPFFTKLVCRELFRLMVSRRDRHVTPREIEEAITLTVNSASTVSFQHFWDDGIFELGEKKEEISLRRRKMLIAFADAARPDGYAGKNELRLAAERYGIDSVIFDEYLHEFQTRNVWTLSEGFISCKVPLFSRWLRHAGVKSIITSILDPEATIAHRRQQETSRVSSEELVKLVSGWGTFKGSSISEDKVRGWLAQFGSDPRKQRLMFSLLQNVRFFSSAMIREKMREAHQRIATDVILTRERQKRSDILVSYLDHPGKSGAHYARLYADENDIYFANVVEPEKLADRIDEKKHTLLLFIDDFLGTGLTAARGIERILSIHGGTLSRAQIAVTLFAVCGFVKSKEAVEKTAKPFHCDCRVLIGDVLSEDEKAFSESGSIFTTASDREDAKTLAYATGSKLEPKCPLGFNDSQALVVFDASCPNNTLPILWSQNKDWTPLFRRR